MAFLSFYVTRLAVDESFVIFFILFLLLQLDS